MNAINIKGKSFSYILPNVCKIIQNGCFKYLSCHHCTYCGFRKINFLNLFRSLCWRYTITYKVYITDLITFRWSFYAVCIFCGIVNVWRFKGFGRKLLKTWMERTMTNLWRCFSPNNLKNLITLFCTKEFFL